MARKVRFMDNDIFTFFMLMHADFSGDVKLNMCNPESKNKNSNNALLKAWAKIKSSTRKLVFY